MKYLEFRSAESLHNFMKYFKNIFVIICLSIMYLHSIFGKPKSYKNFAFYGILIMLGILFVMI